MKYPEIARRFNQIMNIRGLKAVDLAEKAGIGKASISQYVNGNHAPSNDTAQTLGDILKVNPLWLMGFEVNMEKVSVDITDTNYDKTNSREAKLVALYGSLSPSQQTLVDNLLENLVSKQ